MSGTIRVEKRNALGILWFANPRHGIMDAGTEAAFGPALDAVEHDDAIRVVILTGSQPGIFVGHFDLALLRERGAAMAARGMTFSPERPVPETLVHKAFRRITESSKPFICAINGTAIGGGLELALSCDYRLAEDGTYSLGQPEVNVGLLPGAGGTQRLIRVVGLSRAMDLLLSGRTVSPRKAVELGLVHACVEGAVMTSALDLAQMLALKPTRALAYIKRLAHLAASAPLSEGLAVERTLFCDLLVSDDALTAMADILEGRRTIENEKKHTWER